MGEIQSLNPICECAVGRMYSFYQWKQNTLALTNQSHTPCMLISLYCEWDDTLGIDNGGKELQTNANFLKYLALSYQNQQPSINAEKIKPKSESRKHLFLQLNFSRLQDLPCFLFCLLLFFCCLYFHVFYLHIIFSKYSNIHSFIWKC